jgi:glucose-6-phosphate isomerase, archaeal
MQPELEPFTVSISDYSAGLLHPSPEPVERRLGDMKGMYQVEPDEPDKVTYRVYNIDVPRTNSNIMSSTTALYPGRVGREYAMTKGHFHAVRDRAEIYFCLSGAGLLLMATEDGQVTSESMTPGTVTYVPGHWAHRTVNTGDDTLVFFVAYVADAGYDYATIEDQGFPAIVVEGADGPVLEPNPRYVR